MSASEQIDKPIAELDGWRGQLVARLRQLILDVDPTLAEGWKWNNPVRQGDALDGPALKELIRAAVTQNTAGH